MFRRFFYVLVILCGIFLWFFPSLIIQDFVKDWPKEAPYPDELVFWGMVTIIGGTALAIYGGIRIKMKK